MSYLFVDNASCHLQVMHTNKAPIVAAAEMDAAAAWGIRQGRTYEEVGRFDLVAREPGYIVFRASTTRKARIDDCVFIAAIRVTEAA